MTDTAVSILEEGLGSFSQAKIPTGADLNWRTVWPGQWTCDNAGYIWADSLRGGRTHMIDVRGWGYLTGRGMGALDLSHEDARRIQDELGALLCAAPDLLEALKIARSLSHVWDECFEYRAVIDAALAKATTASSAGTSGEAEREPKPARGVRGGEAG